jgi:hypothetical protein
VRNDARPIGEAAGHDRSPLRGHSTARPERSSASDERNEATSGRPLPPVNRGENDIPDRAEPKNDPVMPANDSALKTRI